ncbi:hypothetical protein PMIT1327_00656 [Prochlorococcus marinus str. MIT 1327]|nr:hypothetical protein PMIT1312_00996 [Prochlorococcus marinus str. MIT 1312]KZR82999.1 hypothetical protein PMIT1327_00656 [Prochlorococcus marinus str. MIT 1327]
MAPGGKGGAGSELQGGPCKDQSENNRYVAS